MEKQTQTPQLPQNTGSSSLFQICHDWKHVQGHIATDKWNNLVEASNEEEAILKFKESNPDLGQYIKKDVNDNYWFYGSRSLFQSKENNIVYAVRL
jgi:hypothetical protein